LPQGFSQFLVEGHQSSSLLTLSAALAESIIPYRIIFLEGYAHTTGRFPKVFASLAMPKS
jgi:hypothetical protein